MREILFRAKRKDNGEWVYGSLLMQSGEWISKDELTPTEYHILGCRGENDLVIPETVGQYTGLKDKKNGVEIFEWDIVKAYDTYTGMTFIGVVKFGNGSFYICELHSNSHYRWNDYEVEVIGNIFGNPELLEVEEHE